jgi:hypothetical protein
MSDTLIKDVLYYTHEDSGSSVDKAKGVIIGVVSVLMARGMGFDNALGRVYHLLPKGWRIECMPKEWQVPVQK